MEEKKRGRGRPRIDAHISEQCAPSRRQAVNEKYMYDAVDLLSVAATDILDGHLLYHSDDATMTVLSRNGILEQLGRMVAQDHCSHEDCVYVVNLAIAAVRVGHKTREIELAIREIRMAIKNLRSDPDDKALEFELGKAIGKLDTMGRE